MPSGKKDCAGKKLCGDNILCKVLGKLACKACKIVKGALCLTKFVVKTAVAVPCRVIGFVAGEI